MPVCLSRCGDEIPYQWESARGFRDNNLARSIHQVVWESTFRRAEKFLHLRQTKSADGHAFGRRMVESSCHFRLIKAAPRATSFYKRRWRGLEVASPRFRKR